MKTRCLIVLLVIILNTVISLLYLLLTFYRDKRSKKKMGYHDRVKTWIIFTVMLLCVGVGPLFVGISFLLRHTVFDNPVDLDDVIFGKDRAATRHPADTERERNMAPMEEALAVSDKSSLRTLMLNVLKGDVSLYLSSISKALNSSDSETAHYAATVLRDELNLFRANVSTMYNKFEANDSDSMVVEGRNLMEYMNDFLMQSIFTPMEQKSYVESMEQVADRLFAYEHNALLPLHFEHMCMRLLDLREMERCSTWCTRGMETYPQELSSYTCMLRFLFQKGDRENFLATLDQLKKSEIIIDKETLELIRIFSK
ncbi:MAG: hypothetical protein J6Z06_04320 [Lachnospiraceae bacterium]|nr:hypothetical protein [Lachnospiraceae bacterium]